MAAASSSLARRAVSWRRLLLSRAFGAAAGPAKRVLVPVANGTEPIEAAATANVLNRAGARVTVSHFPSPTALSLCLQICFFLQLTTVQCVPYCSIGVRALCNFKMLVRYGGMPGSANLRDCKVLEKMVKKHAEEGGLYGAICASPAVALAHWGMLKGLKATCYPSFMEKFPSDVIPVNSRVVVDRNAVASQGPGTSIEFALALVEQLYGKEKMEEVAGPLYVGPQDGAEYTIEELNPVKWKCNGTPQVLVPVANDSEEMEALNLIDILRRVGANVIVASVEDKSQIVTRRHKFNLVADMMLDEAAKMEFDLIVMPGGLLGAEKFASTEKLVDLLKKQAESNKPYGAICASPAHVLEPHGLLKGKKATAFPPMAHLLTDQSHCENRVVIDGNLITSRAPGTATEFAVAIVDKLFGREKALSIAKELIFM
ncbi:hypothetical protein ACQ4PT_060078 [Festuca glaucescens]